MSRKSVLVGWLVLALVCCCLLVTQICLVDFLKPFFFSFFLFFLFNVPDPYVGLDPAFTGFICLDLDLTFTSSLSRFGVADNLQTEARRGPARHRQLPDRNVTRPARHRQLTDRNVTRPARHRQLTDRNVTRPATQTTYRQEYDQASKTQTTYRQECDQASKTQTIYRQECDQASKTQTTYRQECDQASNTGTLQTGM